MVSHPGHPLFLALVTLCNFISVLLFYNGVCSVCAVEDTEESLYCRLQGHRHGSVHTVKVWTHCCCLLNYPLIHDTVVSQPPWIQAYSQAGLAK